jgi:hypothetical protein
MNDRREMAGEGAFMAVLNWWKERGYDNPDEEQISDSFAACKKKPRFPPPGEIGG